MRCRRVRERAGSISTAEELHAYSLNGLERSPTFFVVLSVNSFLIIAYARLDPLEEGT